ncbi:MAG: YggS family pyridoxal phosphate-dependent enzyme [Nitrospirota bacterium]
MSNTAISDNIRTIYKRISQAAMRTGRNSGDVKLVAVTKTVSIERIKEAVDTGLRIFGENRVQEARAKIEELSRLSTIDHGLPTISWHLVGHLQKNKAKMAVQLFDLIHSLDSIGLADELNKYAEKTGKVQKVLVQVKLSEEETKHGVPREGLMDLIKAMSVMKNLKLEGLMTMPPFFEDPEKTRPYFKRLREIRDAVNSSLVTRYSLLELSMGMTHDFEVAIEEGATMVRIGTGIFGERK